jgi:hypothetical protein
MWGGGSVVCSSLQGQSPVGCTWSYEATVFLFAPRRPFSCFPPCAPHPLGRSLDPQSWQWSAVQASSATAPSPSLYPIASAGPDNSVLVYAGCAAQPICNNPALSSSALYGKLTGTGTPAITWTSVAPASVPAPVYAALFPRCICVILCPGTAPASRRPGPTPRLNPTRPTRSWAPPSSPAE